MVCPINRVCMCGPAAIAGITGLSVDFIEETILEYRKHHKPPKGQRINPDRKSMGMKIMGMWAYEIVDILDELGFVTTLLPIRKGATVGQFLSLADMSKHYVILYTGHYIALGRGLWVDSFHRVPEPLATFKKNKKKIAKVWMVYAKG